MKLSEDHLSVLEATTKEELLVQLARFAGNLGFQTVTASAVLDHSVGESEFAWVDNAPAAYREVREDRDTAKRDPVMQHCKRSSLPIAWSQATYIQAGQGDVWEEQARFGYRYGICYAMHLPEGRHFLFGVDRDQPLPKDSAEIGRMVAALLAFAVYAQDASMRILVPLEAQELPPCLSPRELDTLRWTMEGKTAWEVGRILGIAEDTVARHAHSATRKLGCSSKLHAVVKALRLGLIQ